MDVFNRIAAVLSNLLAVVIQSEVAIRKQQHANPVFVRRQARLGPDFSTELHNILPQHSGVTGVGAANVFGLGMTYAMCIWVKPDIMATYGILEQLNFTFIHFSYIE
ncbi:hypothetical protein [Arachidicoccus sp.]|uniref:hypothetical protein n=1 Tax=Arachidicoccus sp. TaxID=1872624 RepID=UPI003D1B3146